MRSLSLLFLLFLIFSPTSVFAGQTAAPQLWIHAVNGDRETTFLIPNAESPVLLFSDNSGTEKSARLSRSNFKYIMHQISELSSHEPMGSNCPRSYIEVHAQLDRQFKAYGACINSPSSNSTKLLQLINLLGIIL